MPTSRVPGDASGTRSAIVILRSPMRSDEDRSPATPRCRSCASCAEPRTRDPRPSRPRSCHARGRRRARPPRAGSRGPPRRRSGGWLASSAAHEVGRLVGRRLLRRLRPLAGRLALDHLEHGGAVLVAALARLELLGERADELAGHLDLALGRRAGGRVEPDRGGRDQLVDGADRGDSAHGAGTNSRALRSAAVPAKAWGRPPWASRKASSRAAPARPRPSWSIIHVSSA